MSEGCVCWGVTSWRSRTRNKPALSPNGFWVAASSKSDRDDEKACKRGDDDAERDGYLALE
jgi:hypothetical protein